MYKIVTKSLLNHQVLKMVVHAPYVARRCEPGQFIILRVSEDGERIPLTIADYDRENGTVTIIFQVVGKTTKILETLDEGDSILDFVGPLGKATELPDQGRVLVIGGGVGAAPLYPQAKKLHEQGVHVDAIIGGRTEEHLLLTREFEAITASCYYATNDGSAGIQGFVTDVLKDLLDKQEQYDEVIAIGPLIMMKAVVGITKPLQIPTNVSLNPIMVDGTGMCGGCRVRIGDEMKFACVDGPDFDGLKVDFDELMHRQNYYKDQEKQHQCNLDAAFDAATKGSELEVKE